MTQKFYTVQEVISGKLRSNYTWAVNGEQYRIYSVLPDHTVVAKVLGNKSFLILDPTDFFVRPNTIKENVEEYWFEKFGKKLTEETFSKLRDLFAGKK